MSEDHRPVGTVGALLVDIQPPGELVAAGRRAERAGFEELWVGEDYFFGGGIATAATLLAQTQIPVGLGIAPVGGRHPAVLALELAVLAGIHPGRLHAGIGAGVPELADQIGTAPTAPLSAVAAALGTLKSLLAGDTVSAEGETFVARDVSLGHAPAKAPPLYVGAAGPRMLRLSGAEADGTVLSVLAGRDYVRWARERLREGGAGADHRLVVYALCAVDANPQLARDALRELVAFAAIPSPRNPLSEVQGFAEEAEQLSALGLEAAIPRIPDRWLDDLTIAGTPAECTAKILALFDAGADTVALCFPPDDNQGDMIDAAGQDILPEVKAVLSDAKAVAG